MFYYLRVVVAMYLRDGKEAEVVSPAGVRFVAGLCLAVTLFLGVWPTPLINEVRKSTSWFVTRVAANGP